jgi:uncharacterized membrane protein YobD (UPF0266 family)
VNTSVLYVARYPWSFRLVALGGIVIFAILRPNITVTWRNEGWFFGVGLLVAYLFVVLGFLEAFVRQTWLTNGGFRQRSMFGRTRFVPYDQIQELVIERDEALIVKYQNNRRLKIHAKEGNPETIIERARKFLDPHTVVTMS